jgi:hypothetical protein
VADGAVRAHEIGGGAAVDEYSPRTIGLTLAEGKVEDWLKIGGIGARRLFLASVV